MRACLFALALLATAPAFAETDDQNAHLAEAAGLRLLHVWTPATAAGSDALFYMEIENTTAAEAMLTGGAAAGQKLELVGFGYGAAGESWTPLPGLPVAADARIALDPKVIALRWTAIPADLTEGTDLEITVIIGGQSLHAKVEITAAAATAHSHAGHNH